MEKKPWPHPRSADKDDSYIAFHPNNPNLEKNLKAEARAEAKGYKNLAHKQASKKD